VSYHRNEKNLGIGGNWNRCLELAKTEFVTLLHADDVLLPSYAESMLAAADRYPEAAFYFCNAAIINAKSHPTFSFPDYIKSWIQPPPRPETLVQGDAGLAQLLRGCFIMCPTICYRFAKIPPKKFNESRKQVLDLEFYTEVLFGGGALIGIADTCYLYRRHQANQTAQLSANLTRFDEEISLYDELAVKAMELNWPQSANVARKKTMIKLNLGYCVLSDLILRKWLAAWQKLTLLTMLMFGPKPRLKRISKPC